MSWGWSDQTRKAIDFLNTGSSQPGLYISGLGADEPVSDESPVSAESTSTGGSTTSATCFDSSHCASGFGCIGGVCVSTSADAHGGSSSCGNNSGSSQSGSSGGTSGAPGGGGGGCGGPSGGGGASATTSTGGTPAGACVKSGCGTKPSQGNSAGSAGGSGGGGGGNGGSCCGSSRCCRMGAGFVSCFCGECPPPPGCNPFCDNYSKANGAPAPGCDPNQCTECEECVTDALGAGKCEPAGGPCWCPGSECNGTCASCQDDGSCQESCSNCMTCVTLYNVCDCSPFSIRCCYSACTTGLSPTNRCQIEAGKKCDEKCPPPPGPGPCLCNCHVECPDCFLCGTDGKCYPDPQCTEKYVYKIAWQYEVSYYGSREGDCLIGPFEGQLDVIAAAAYGGKISDGPYSLEWRSITVPGVCADRAPSCSIPTAVFFNVYRNGIKVSTGISDPGKPAVTCKFGTVTIATDEVGVAVGYGDTLQEAIDNANAALPVP